MPLEFNNLKLTGERSKELFHILTANDGGKLTHYMGNSLFHFRHKLFGRVQSSSGYEERRDP